jgi:DNA-directed RNA polymerase specialized sigma24 family protein
MQLSESEFASAVRLIRPSLVQTARRLRRCTSDDAEDLVSEVILVALPRLSEFDGRSGSIGLRRWLTAILHHQIQRDLRTARCRPAARSFEEMPGVEPVSDGTPHTPDHCAQLLPFSSRQPFLDWLEGCTHEEIARRNRIHRNTVAARLDTAFAALRAQYADAGELEYAYALFNACARATIYRKPTGVWLPWRRQHPPEAPFRRSRIRSHAPGKS